MSRGGEMQKDRLLKLIGGWSTQAQAIVDGAIEPDLIRTAMKPAELSEWISILKESLRVFDRLADELRNRPRDPHDWQSWAWEMIERGGLSGREGLVLLALVQYGNGDGTARPATRTLAGRVGVSDRPVREALDALRDRGYIDGDPAPRRTTTWRFVTDEDEQRRLRALRTHPPKERAGSPADPSPAASAEHLRSICGPRVRGSRSRSRRKVNFNTSLSTELQRVRRERECHRLVPATRGLPVDEQAEGRPRMTRERCSTCKAPLVWTGTRLVCPRPTCPGHQRAQQELLPKEAA